MIAKLVLGGKMNLKIGDIVKVVNEECKHWGRQGQVVGFDLTDKKNPVRIWFGKECDHFFDYPHNQKLGKYAVIAPNEAKQVKDMRTWNYAEGDLQKESEWSVKTLVERYLKDMCHSYYEPKNSFVAGATDCDVENCRKPTTQRIIYNIWGSVYTAEVCDEHAKQYHLKCMDDFPCKKGKVH